MRMKGLVLLKLDEEQPAEIAGCSFCSQKFVGVEEIGDSKGRKNEKMRSGGLLAGQAG